MRILSAFFTGAIFSLGLIVSGMTDTEKVRGFLDIAGQWDPTLAFVMMGAMAPMLVAWRIASYKKQSLLGDAITLNPPLKIDRSLVIGAVFFGVGWGLIGFCPGPNITSLSYGGFSGLVFFTAMLAAMWIHAMYKNNME